MWMAGGGVKGGYAYGATDDYGYYAAENKMHIHDLHATLLHLLGLDHERLTYRYAGRDFRLMVWRRRGGIRAWCNLNSASAIRAATVAPSGRSNRFQAGKPRVFR
jgi:hypothetical protein